MNRKLILLNYIIAFILLVAGVITNSSNSHNGYSLFILDDIKPLFIMRLFAFFLVFITFLISLHIKDLEYFSSRLYIFMLLVILLTISITSLYSWKISGYYYSIGLDLFNYIGTARDIIGTSHISVHEYYPNFYPAQDLLIATLSIVINEDISSLFFMVPSILYFIIIVLVLYLVSKQLILLMEKSASLFLKEVKVPLVLVTATAGMTNFLDGFIFPYKQTYSIILFGIFLFMFLKFLSEKHTKSYFSLFPIILIFPFAHPITSLLLLAFLVGTYLTITDFRDRLKILLLTYSFVLMLWLIYYSFSGLLGTNFKSYVFTFEKETTATQLSKMFSESLGMGVELWKIFLYTMLLTHPAISYYIVWLTVSILLIKRKSFSKILSKLTFILLFMVTVYALLSFLFYVHNPIRIVIDNPFMFLVVPLTISGIFSALYTKKSKQLNLTIKLLLLLNLMLILTTSVLSPWIEKEISILPSNAITFQENAGVIFFYQYVEQIPMKICTLGTLQSQISAFISKDLGMLYKPAEFRTKYIENITSESYVFLPRKEVIAYKELYSFDYFTNAVKEIYTYQDIIYQNKELTLFKYKPTKTD